MMDGFWLGIGCGVLATIPLAVVAVRRAARRVRRLEQRARSTERLAELGTLTGGLAHEIKNPLSTVGLNLQLIQEDLRDLSRRSGDETDEEPLKRVQRRFESLSKETQRLGDILDDFLRYAGRVQLERKPTDVHVLIGELADFFNPQAEAAGVQLRTQLDAPDAMLNLDRDMLKQALLNLMVNACQAMSDARRRDAASGGSDELIIRTRRDKVPGHGPELRIDVIDTGPGMEPSVTEKIFQPYFTQKKGGTGLGLPTSRRIIEEHGGVLTCHSEPGRGTDFTISLPVTD
jgi:signal transduction histidine kinase